MGALCRIAAATFLAISVGFTPSYSQIPIAGPATSWTLAPLLKTVTPSVVSIAVRRPLTQNERSLLDDPLLQEPNGAPASPDQYNSYAAGSGVIIDGGQGFIVTGGHVVDRASEIVVILADGRSLAAKMVGVDRETDIAVVKVLAGSLTAIRMGDSERTQVGDFVLAIGNPFNIGQTVTSGIVSTLRRRSFGSDRFEDLVQTDAAINLGSSGGALVNLEGEMIGMNVAILNSGDSSSASVGIGFAVPINTVRTIAHQLITYGSARHGQLGLAVASVRSDNLQTSGYTDAAGVVIVRIESGSWAALAGLRVGDLITTFNFLPIRDPVDLQVKTALTRVGDMVELTIVRQGKPLSVRAKLTEPSEQKPS